MAVRGVDFYALPVSIASGEYPLFTDAGAPSKYLKHSVSDVKVTYDMDQDLIVPTFDGYETISMVYLGGIGYYWVVGVETSTIYNATLVFHLHYCAASSNVRTGESLKGIWSRRPTFDNRIQQTVSSSPIMTGQRAYLPTMSSTLNKHLDIEEWKTVKTYWIQITSKNYISESNVVVSTSRLTRYGLFACRQQRGQSDFWRWNVSGPNSVIYPTVEECINDIEKYLGITADSIIDISVVPISPYLWSEKVETKTDDSGNEYTWYSTSLVSSTGEVLEPKIGKDITVTIGSLKSTFKYRCYNLDPNDSLETGLTTTNQLQPASSSLRLELSTFEINTASFELRDWTDNPVGSFPVVNPVSTWTVNYACDTTGIYTIVTDTTSGQHLTIPSLKLPWVGSQWETYKAYSMDTDRTVIRYAQEQYDLQYRQDMMSAAFNGIIGAGVGAAVGGPAAGVGALIGGGSSLISGVMSGYLGKQLNDMKLQQDQKLTERRVRSAPGISYSTTYGLNQLDIHERFIGGVYILINSYFYNEDFNKYTAEFGFPTEGVQTLTMQAGYYKGRILATDEMSGVIFDRLQEEFNNGFKFKQF